MSEFLSWCAALFERGWWFWRVESVYILFQAYVGAFAFNLFGVPGRREKSKIVSNW